MSTLCKSLFLNIVSVCILSDNQLKLNDYILFLLLVMFLPIKKTFTFKPTFN